MHSLPYPEENVSGSQQTRQGGHWGRSIGRSKKWRGRKGTPMSIVSELFQILLLFIIMFDRNIAFARRNACTYRVSCQQRREIVIRENRGVPWPAAFVSRTTRRSATICAREYMRTKHYANIYLNAVLSFLHNTARKIKSSEIQGVICP